MRLVVSDIPEEGLERELKLSVKLNDNVDPDIAHASLTVYRIKKKVLVEGSIKVDTSFQCGRCLNDFSCPLNLTFREEYNPVEEISKEDAHELTDAEMGLGFYQNDEIDLAELVEEQILLEVPMKPLCKEDCAGICSTCGQNINVKICECKTEETDPRLASLQELKESMKNRETF